MTTVTIIANKRESDKGTDSTAFVADVSKRLDAIATAQKQPLPARATSVIDVKIAIEKALADAAGPIAVQLVGHGLVGQLLLGWPWMVGDDTAKIARAYPFLVLDSNPTTLQFLQDFATHISSITLAGCHIGDLDVTGSGWAINGRSLTYCLSELLRCEVSAAIGFVGSDAFDNSGLYNGPRSSWTWKADGPPTWATTGKAEAEPLDTGTPLPIDGITHTYLHTHNDSPHPATATAKVVPIQHQPLRDALKTATPEMTVSTLKHGDVKIVGNARYIVAKDQQYRVTNRHELTRQLGAALRKG